MSTLREFIILVNNDESFTFYQLTQETAQSQGVTAMPTFIFYKNKVKVDEMKGADAAALEEKIKRLMGDGEEGADEVTVKGHVSVITLHYILHYITIITSYTLHIMGGEEKEQSLSQRRATYT